MAIFKRNPSPTPSLSSMVSDISISANDTLSADEEEVRNFVSKRFRKRLFLGHYQERRYVDYLGVYRDMVVLHSSETELKVEVDRVQSKLRRFYGDGKWLGITCPDTIGAPAAGHCFWTKLEEVAFGFYWFQIKKICFQDREIVIRLKVIRAVREEIAFPVISTSFSHNITENVDSLKARICAGLNSLKENEAESSKSDKSPSANAGIKNVEGSSRNLFASSGIGKEENDSFPDTVTKTLKLEDILVLLRFLLSSWREIFTFLCMAANGLGKCVEYVGDFSIKLIHEVSFLIRSLTPIFLAIIELVGKIIGGLYLLIAMIFRGPPPPQQFLPPNQNRPHLAIRNVPQVEPYSPFQRANRPRRYKRD
ncbi:Trigger factor [Frankliniella fusca]|uniref:Trigger factor n=1 Tax=Frankliniella fusca TaxID=407009 RepID=A0AAE1LLF8_9NEOP|nr:Trigger factor [Frankliniella fusca]